MKPRFRTEHEFQEAVRHRLHFLDTPSAWYKVHGGLYQPAGMADLIGCIRGTFVALEFKRAGERPTPRQDAFLRAIARARGFAAVIAPDRLDIYPVVGGVPQDVAILIMRVHREVMT